MQFFELLQTQSWESVEAMLMFHHPQFKQSLPGFRRAFDNLLKIQPQANNHILSVIIIKQQNEPHVCAMIEKQPFDLLIMPWSFVSGMQVAPNLLKNHSYPDIVALVLWELTRLGFDEDTILQQKNTLLGSYNNQDEQKTV